METNLVQPEGWYYLHVNGDLIYKRFPIGDEDSPFIKRIWPVNTKDRLAAWTVVLESLSLGANLDRVKELATKWKLTFEDSIELLKHSPRGTSKEMIGGMDIFIRQILNMAPEAYWAKVKEEWKV